MNVSSLASWVVSWVRVIGSTVASPNSAVLVGGESGVGALDESETETSGEQITDAEAYGAPGIVFRPRKPESVPVDGIQQELSAEAMAVRTPGGLVPLAWRDLRWNLKFPAPKEGSVALVGYGGGFVSLDDTVALETRITLYVTYGSKAHCIVLDPESESISIVHGDGFAITMDPDNGIVMRGDDTTRMQIKPGEVSIIASKILLQGNVAAGANPAIAVPLLPGPASPPSPSFFVSPV